MREILIWFYLNSCFKSLNLKVLDTMFGLPLIDIIVIIIYFVIVIAIGLWSMRRIKNQEDYFLAGRRFGKFIQTFAAFGQGTSADTAIGVSTTTFSNGAAGMWRLAYLSFCNTVLLVGDALDEASSSTHPW